MLGCPRAVVDGGGMSFMDDLERLSSKLVLGPSTGAGKLVEGLLEATGVGVAEKDEEKYVEGRMMDRGDLKVCVRTWRTDGM